jgi:hypothetical protein
MFSGCDLKVSFLYPEISDVFVVGACFEYAYCRVEHRDLSPSEIGYILEGENTLVVSSDDFSNVVWMKLVILFESRTQVVDLYSPGGLDNPSCENYDFCDQICATRVFDVALLTGAPTCMFAA